MSALWTQNGLDLCFEKKKWNSKEYGYELGQGYVCVKFGQVKIGDVFNTNVKEI